MRLLALLLAALPIGSSVDGHTIRPIVLGDPAAPHRVLVVGCIHGTETARWLGYDLTGKFIDEGANKVWIEMAQDHLSQVANTGRPALERHFNTIVGHRNLNVEALVLPLATDGHVPDFLINILIPHSSDPLWKAQPPRTERFLLDELAVVAR